MPPLMLILNVKNAEHLGKRPCSPPTLPSPQWRTSPLSPRFFAVPATAVAPRSIGWRRCASRRIIRPTPSRVTTPVAEPQHCTSERTHPRSLSNSFRRTTGGNR